MTITPTKAAGISIYKLKQLVAQSTEFQTSVGVANAAEALAFVHVPRKKASPKQNDKPFAVIKPPQSGLIETQFAAGGAANEFLLKGSLELSFYRDVGVHATEEDELYDFLNWIEEVHRDLLDLAGVDDNLAIIGLPCILGPVISDDTKIAGGKAQKRFYKATFEVQWGLGA